MKTKLNEMQKAFVDYYIQTCNATESAKRAGYSENSAMQQGCELLRNPKVQAAIQSRLKQLESERIAQTKERLKAAEMLAKVNGLFITRQEVELSGVLPVVIADDF